MYKFSVAIPTYNSSDYLRECIYGFRKSKYIDEIVISDDGSDIAKLQLLWLPLN